MVTMVLSGNLFRRPIDFPDSLPQLRPDNCLVRALMGNPFRFRFPYHGLILIGTGTGAVLCERTGINIIVQKASDGCVSPQPGILAAAISVMDRPVPAGRENPFLIQGGGDFPIGHAGLTHLEYLPHNSGVFPVNDQLVSVQNFYKIFTF